MRKTHKIASAPDKTNEAFLSVKAVAARYGVHQASIWGWAKNDNGFPQPVKFSERCTRWRLSDLVKWEIERGAAT